MSNALLKAVSRSMRHRAAFAIHGARPEKIRLAVTNRCNARCVMCNVWKADVRDAKRVELRVDEYDRIFSQSRETLSKLKHVSLTGGETTLRSDLADIVSAIAKHHPKVSFNINTNAFDTGRLMGFVEKATQSTGKLTVMVSLDGMGEAHDKIRGIPGVFEKTFGSIERLLEFRDSNGRLKVGINTTLSEWNYGKDFEEIHAFCKARGVKFTPIVPQSGEFFHNETTDVSLKPEMATRYAELIERVYNGNGGATLQMVEVLEQLRGGTRDYRCWAGSIMLLIEEQGEVYPNGGCPSGWSLGSLRKHDYDLGRLLRSEQAAGILEQVRTCRRCRLACETLTTLRGPEALAAHRKMIAYAANDDDSNS